MHQDAPDIRIYFVYNLLCIYLLIYYNYFQLNGNKNGYQASVTHFSIFNVRNIKIKSTDRQRKDFCLRLELCGQGWLLWYFINLLHAYS